MSILAPYDPAYLLFLGDDDRAARAGREHSPIYVVHAEALLLTALPQPDGANMYRCLVEAPERAPGCVVPLSTITYELDGGRLWCEVGDWLRVINILEELIRARRCSAMVFPNDGASGSLLAMGPYSQLTFISRLGEQVVGRVQRMADLDVIADTVAEKGGIAEPFPAQLVTVPREPVRMPFAPWNGRPGGLEAIGVPGRWEANGRPATPIPPHRAR